MNPRTRVVEKLVEQGFEVFAPQSQYANSIADFVVYKDKEFSTVNWRYFPDEYHANRFKSTMSGGADIVATYVDSTDTVILLDTRKVARV